MDDFVIKYKDLRDISQKFKTNLNCLISDLESLESSINNFIDLDKGHYDGEGADAAKSYFQDVHITMVNGLKNAAQSLIDEMAIYKSGFYDIDPGTNFVISKEVILEFQEKLLSYAQQVYTDDGNELSPENTIKKELSSISDIYDGSYPSETAEEIISCHEELNTTMTNLIEKTETLEENIILGLEANTDSLISQIDGMNSVIGVDWQGMKDYSANSIFSNPTMTSLCTYSEQVESMHVLNEETLDGIWENEAELIEKAEERVDQGYEKVFTGCIEMGSGVISIFGTGGLAIPFGITEVAIGYSDFTEGIDDICYGSEGDITTTSTNYAKSVVYYFGGNDETYYAVRDVVMFAGAAANPIAGELQAGTCTTKTIVSAVTKEVVSTGAGEVTSQITYNITKDENLSMLAGMASSYGTSKGLGTIESKFTKSSSMTSGKIKDTTSELIEGCDDINSTKIQSEGPYANVEAQKTTQGPLIDDDVIGGNKVGNVEGPYKSGSKANLLDHTGKFIDDTLENNYQAYIKRKISKGQTPKDRLEWKQASEYWTKESPVARGNNFNKTVREADIYDYHEIYLENGKRLDSYDPDAGEIISRKATDLDKISEETYRRYLSEFSSKYSEGTKIRSNAYPELDGQELRGQYILEIPASNANLSNIDYYEKIASEYDVILRFTEEVQ